jgi:hypothetical protein
VGQDVPDNQSGYRLIGRQLMTALLDSQDPGFEFEVEMIARCIALGLPIAWVPIHAAGPTCSSGFVNSRSSVQIRVSAPRFHA